MGLLELVFPARCAGCDRPGTLLCDSCRSEIVRIDVAYACPNCGAPHGRVHCSECDGRPFAFSGARCAALLAPPVSHAVVTLKDGGERRYADLLARLLADAAGEWLAELDVLVPVPAAPAAVRRRGFDHSADIARHLSHLTGAPVQVLLKAAASADQRSLGRSARFANREGTFRIAAGMRIPARLVLIDDVFTTGATLDGAARVLLNAGAEEVRALAVARSCRPVPVLGSVGQPS